MAKDNHFTTQCSAALRLASIPAVRSACSLLTVCYEDTKRRHPSLASACGLLESSVTSVTAVAYHRFSPVLHKMEPQIVVVNDLTCRGLDWLENRFPVLQKPTEEITAEARAKILEVKELVSIVGSGTVHLVQHTVTWAVWRIHLVLVAGGGGGEVAVVVGDRRAHPPLVARRTRDRHAADRSGCVEGFEVDLVQAGGAQLVASLTGQMLRRSYLGIQTTLHHVKEHFSVALDFSRFHAQVVKHQMEELVFKSPYLVEQLLGVVLTQAWGLRDLTQQMHHQLMSAMFFVSQMTTPPPPHTSTPNAAPNGQPVNRSPLDESPVFPQGFRNGKQRKEPVKRPSTNCSHVAGLNGVTREIAFF